MNLVDGIRNTFGGAFNVIGRLTSRVPGLTLAPHYLANLLWLIGEKFYDLAKQSYSGNAAVYACLRVLSTAVPEPPLIARIRNSDGTVGDPINFGHPLTDLIANPNELMTEYEMWELVVLHLGIIGRSTWFKERNNLGLPIALWPLRPDRVGPIYSIDDVPGQRVVKGWSYLVPGTSIYIPIPREDVWLNNLPDPTGESGGLVEGLGPLQVLAGEVGADNEATRFVGAIMANYATPGLLLSVKSTIRNKEQAQLIKASFMREFGGARRGMPGVVDADTSVTQIGFNLRQLEFPDVRRISEARISAALGVPAILAGLSTGLDSGIRATIAEQREYFAETTLSNYWRRLSTSFTRDVAIEFDKNFICEFDTSKVRALSAKLKMDTDRLAAAFAQGAVLVDEYREKVLYLPAIGGVFGRSVWVPTSGALTDPETYFEPSLEPPPGSLFDQNARIPEPNGGTPNKQLVDAIASGTGVGSESGASKLAGKGNLGFLAATGVLDRPGMMMGKVSAIVHSRTADAGKINRNTRSAIQFGDNKYSTRLMAYFKRLGAYTAARFLAEAKAEGADIPSEYTTELKNILGELWYDILGKSYIDATDTTGVSVKWDATNPRVKDTISELAKRVVRIDDTTREWIRTAVARSTSEGRTIDQLAKDIREGSVEPFSKSRAITIARTESGTAYNKGAVLAYAEAGLTHVSVLDGDYDEECAAANGQVWTLAEAQANPLQHPRCTRAFAPIVDIPKIPQQNREFSILDYPREYADVSTNARFDQANYTDIGNQMNVELRKIRAPMVDLPSVSGVVTKDKVEIISDNMRATVSAYGNYLAGDTMDMLHQYISQFERGTLRRVSGMKGIDAGELGKITQDFINKAMFQEVESNRQQFTDHGIRHIIGNVQKQALILDELEKQGYTITARDRLLADFVAFNHDVGYTVPLVRAGGLRGIDASHDHPAFSEKIAMEQKSIWNENKIFTEAEYERAASIIATHSKSDLSVQDPVALAVRIADNTALFQAEKLPSVFEYVPEGRYLLTEMQKASAAGDMEAFDQARLNLRASINRTTLDTNLKRDLQAAVGEINKYTGKFTIGTMAGRVESLSHDSHSLITMKVGYNAFDQFLQKSFDMGQQATHKLLKGYGITDFTKNRYELGKVGDKVILTLEITGRPDTAPTASVGVVENKLVLKPILRVPKPVQPKLPPIWEVGQPIGDGYDITAAAEVIAKEQGKYQGREINPVAISRNPTIDFYSLSADDRGVTGSAGWSGTIELSSKTSKLLAELIKREKPLDGDHASALGTLLHEEYHMVSVKRDEKIYRTPVGKVLEEGLTESLAIRDLPGFARKLGYIAEESAFPANYKRDYGTYRQYVSFVEDLANTAAGSGASGKTQDEFLRKWKFRTKPADLVKVIADDLAKVAGMKKDSDTYNQLVADIQNNVFFNDYVEGSAIFQGQGAVQALTIARRKRPRDFEAPAEIPPEVSPEVRQRLAEGRPAFTDHEEALLRAYTGSNYMTINNQLRKGSTPKEAFMAKEQQDLIDLVKNHRLPVSVTVYRGVKGQSRDITGLTIGDIIVDKAFTSTSLSIDVSTGFIGGGSTGTVMEIQLPKGQAGIYVPPTRLREGEGDFDISGIVGEQEILLPPGVRLKIVGRREITSEYGTGAVTVLEMIPVKEK